MFLRYKTNPHKTDSNWALLAGEMDWLIKDLSEELEAWGHAGGGNVISVGGREGGAPPSPLTVALLPSDSSRAPGQ